MKLVDLPSRRSKRMMGANPQASDHVQINDVPSTRKETTASATWKTPGEIMTPGVGMKTGRNLFPFRPTQSLHPRLSSGQALRFLGSDSS